MKAKAETKKQTSKQNAVVSPKPETVKPEEKANTEEAVKPKKVVKPVVKSYPPIQAENGDIKGADNDGDGRTEPVYVRGYYRKDGTYVRGHYRASPRR